MTTTTGIATRTATYPTATARSRYLTSRRLRGRAVRAGRGGGSITTGGGVSVIGLATAGRPSLYLAEHRQHRHADQQQDCRYRGRRHVFIILDLREHVLRCNRGPGQTTGDEQHRPVLAHRPAERQRRAGRDGRRDGR